MRMPITSASITVVPIGIDMNGGAACTVVDPRRMRCMAIDAEPHHRRIRARLARGRERLATSVDASSEPLS